MAAASIAVQLGAQIADFKAKFTEASRTTERFAADFKGSAETVEKLQQRLNKAFQDFSGDKIASQAQKMASAIADIGGASRLTEAEQQRVNKTVTEAIAKYQALGKEAPQALLQLAAATQKAKVNELAAETERLANALGGSGLQSAQAYAKAVERIGGVSKLTATEQKQVNTVVTEAIAKYQAMGQRAPQALQELARATKAVPINELAAETERLTKQFGGSGLQSARSYADAVKAIGGVSKLTQAEQRHVNAVVTEAIAKYRALGKEAPADLRALAEATRQVAEPTDVLRERLDGIKNSLQSFASGARSVGIGLTASVTAPIVAAGAAILKLGTDAVESENLVSISFGTMRGAADAWSKNLSKSLGLNEFELRKQAGTLFNMTTSMGLARDEAFSMSTGITKLAADMSSFRNIPMAEALEKIRAGLTGESEPLKRIGILVTENTIKQEAYRVGIAKTGTELTEVQKVQARWSAILRQTANDQGDLARTLESPANQLRIMRTRLEEAATALGVSLMPLFQSFIGLVASVVPHIQQVAKGFAALPEPVKLGAVAIAALAAGVGPVLLALATMATGIASLIPLVNTLAGAHTRGAVAATSYATAQASASGATGATSLLAAASSRLSGVLLGPVGLIAALGGLALAYAGLKTADIRGQANEFEQASQILGRSVKTIDEARAVIKAFKEAGGNLEQPIKAAGDAAGVAAPKFRNVTSTLLTVGEAVRVAKEQQERFAEQTRTTAASSEELAKAASGAVITLQGFGSGTAGIGDVSKGMAAASQRTKQYNADLAKLSADGGKALATIRAEINNWGTGIIDKLASQFGVAESSIQRLIRADGELARAGKARTTQQKKDAQETTRHYEEVRKAIERLNGLFAAADFSEPLRGLESSTKVALVMVTQLADALTNAARAAASIKIVEGTVNIESKLPGDFKIGKEGKNLLPTFPKDIFGTIRDQSEGLSRAFGFLADVTQNRAISAIAALAVGLVNANNAGQQLAAGWKQMRAEGGNLMSGLLQMAQGIISGIASIAQSTGRGSTASRTTGGAIGGAALAASTIGSLTAAGAQLGVFGGPLGIGIGAATGAIVGLIRGMNQGRSAVKDFAESFGGFDALHERLLELGDAGEALWVRLTQGISRGDAKGATDAIAAIEDALAKGKTAAKSFEDEFAAAGFKTRDQLAETARQAVSLYERMRDSGKFTAADIAKAFEQAQEAIRAATGDTAQLESMDRIKAKIGELSTEYDSLFKAVANEAPEEEMGVIEKQMRERLSAIGEERGTLEAQLKSMTEDLQGAFGLVGQAAQTAAQEIVDAFAGLNVTVPFNPSGLQKTASAATDTADKVVTTFANAKVDIPVNDRVFDTLGTSARDAAQHVQDTFAGLNLTLPVNAAAFDALGVSASSVASQITSTFADLRLAIPVDATSFDGLGTAARDATDRITGVFADLDLTIPVNDRVFEVLGTAARDAGADISLTFSRVETTIPLNNRMFEPLEHAARNTAENIEDIFSDLRITIPVSLSMDGLKKLGSGGIIKEPTLALLGESGPEAVIPLDSGFMPETRPIIVQSYLDGKLVAENTARHLPGVLHRRGV